MHIDHIAMYVTHLEKARDFFVTYLGAVADSGYHNKVTDFRSYFLTFSNGARLEVMTRPGIEAKGKALTPAGYAHVAFSLGSKEAVDALTARLKRDGYPILSGPRTTGDGYYESCVIAVEGNLIELTI